MNPFKKVLTFAAEKTKAVFATDRQARMTNRGEPANIGSTVTASGIQSAVRLAESGDTRQLFALYRDIVIAGSHIQCEFVKRKVAVLAQAPSVMPVDKDDPEDVKAATACMRMIKDCANWNDGMLYLLDSTLWPVSVVEKIFKPIDPGTKQPEGVNLRFTLRRLEPVNHALLCFKQQNGEKVDPNQWESDLRFYSTDDEGKIVTDLSKAYFADPNRHMIHRGHALVGIRDNWGGPMRAVVGWQFLGLLGRDWFARFMERYSSPFIVARTDSTDKAAVAFLNDALAQSTKIGAMVVDHETAIELKEAMVSGGADGYDKFLAVCNREISKIVVGQELSATAAATGMGSGVANLQGGVREDIRAFDQQRLAEMVAQQLFTQFLQINGLRGRPPILTWGGADEKKAELSGALLQALSMGGLRPTDDALPILSERFGFGIERVEAPAGGLPGQTLQTFSARFGLPQLKLRHPSDRVAAAKAKALADAYRGSLAPIRQIILSANSAEEAERNIALFFADWNPEKVHQITEEALQICAAAGAGAATR